MPRKPFSFLDPPLTKPYAAGEDNRHLPVMPLLSGQEAIDSLRGYYPSARKMDSRVNPHTYKRPRTLRSTTVPGTKVAELLKAAKLKWRQEVLAVVDPSKSDLVAGFVEKCATAGLHGDALAAVFFEAMSMHPAIAGEFEKCGFVKAAFGPMQSFSMPAQVPAKPKYRPAPSRKFVPDVKIRPNAFSGQPATPAAPLAKPPIETGPPPQQFGFYKPETFQQDYQAWTQQHTPEGRQAFQGAAQAMGMTPERLARAIGADAYIQQQVPYADASNYLMAQEAHRAGQLKEMPQRPSYADRYRAYFQLPPEERQALGQWQNYQIANWRAKDYPNHDQLATPPASIGFSGHPNWYFPAFPEHEAGMFNAQGQPQLLQPEQYMGLADAAKRYGIDFRSKDFRDYWARQQENLAAGDEFVPPFNLLKGYWWDRDRRQGNHDFDKDQDGAFAQRMFGFRRTDPRTGKEVITAGDEIGRNPGGLGGALKETVLGALSSPATVAISAAERDPRYAQMSGRSTLALLDHLLGTDIGWNANTSANPRGMGAGESGAATDIGRNLPTTRALFGSRYDPITGEYKLGDFDSVGTYYNERANDPDRSSLDRVLSRGMSTTMDKGDDVLYQLALMRAMGLKPNMSNMMRTGAASTSLPNLLDPNSPRQGSGRVMGAMGDAAQGYFLPFTGNPLFPMVGQTIKEVPGSKHYYDLADRLRLATSANHDAPGWVQRPGEMAASTMEVAPELLLSGQLGRAGQKFLPGSMGQAAGGMAIPATDAMMYSAGAGAPGGLYLDTSPEAAAYRQQALKHRLSLARPEQMRLDAAESQYHNIMPQLVNGVDVPQESIDQVDVSALPPELQQAWAAATAAPPPRAGRSRLAANEPSLTNRDEVRTLAQGTRDRVQGNQAQAAAMFQQLNPQEQALVAQQMTRATAQYEAAYRRMQPNLSDDQIRALAQEDAADMIYAQLEAAMRQRQQPPTLMVKQQSAREKYARAKAAQGFTLGNIPPLDPNHMLERIKGSAQPGATQAPAAPAQPQTAPTTQTAPMPQVKPPQQSAPMPQVQPPAQPQVQPPANQAQRDRQRMQTPPTPAPQPQPLAQSNATQPAAASQTAAPQPGKPQPATGESQQTGSWTDYIPSWGGIQNFVQQFPDKAQEFAAQAGDQVKAFFGDETAQAELANVQKTGQLSPGAEKAVTAKVAQETGGDEQTTMGIIGNMDGWSKLALFGGLGLGALGLIQAVSGEGGIGSWLMTILGLGAAGFAAGNAGLLGEGAQQLTQGIGEQAGNMTSGLFGPGESGEQKSPLAGGADSFMKKYGPTALKWMPDSLSTPVLKYLAEQNPELASKLDMATGHSNVVGNLLGWGGGLVGYNDNALAEYGFKTPEQQEDLLRRWSLMRDGAQQAAAGT